MSHRITFGAALALAGCNGILDNPEPKITDSSSNSGGMQGSAGLYVASGVAGRQLDEGGATATTRLGRGGFGAAGVQVWSGSAGMLPAASSGASGASNPAALSNGGAGLSGAGGETSHELLTGGSAPLEAGGTGTGGVVPLLGGAGPIHVGGGSVSPDTRVLTTGGHAPTLTGGAAPILLVAGAAGASPGGSTSGGSLGVAGSIASAGTAPTLPTSCTIGQRVYAADTVDPNDHCSICDPAQDTTHWLLRPDGVVCDPGKVCAAHACKTGCWIESQYYEDGAPNPLNPCESCKAARASSSWSNVATAQCVTAIAAGNSHTCAIAGGKAYCWGANSSGQLGNSTVSARSVVPVPVEGLSGALSAVAAGSSHSCAIANLGAKCWGNNYNGQLGSGSSDAGPFGATQVKDLSFGVSGIAASPTFTCAIMDGNGMCWGDNQFKQLGVDWTYKSTEPVGVYGLSNVTTAIATGTDPNNQDAFACAIASGNVLCWGSGNSGQLGTGTSTSSYQPMAVTLSGTVRAIALGSNLGCAVVDSAVYCWGYNRSGQLGNTPEGAKFPPRRVQGLTGTATAVTAGGSYACAIVDGSVYCWGRCNAASADPSVPLKMADLSSVTDISGGDAHTCAIANGSAYCWGENASGQLGNGSTAASSSPMKVTFP